MPIKQMVLRETEYRASAQTPVRNDQQKIGFQLKHTPWKRLVPLTVLEALNSRDASWTWTDVMPPLHACVL